MRGVRAPARDSQRGAQQARPLALSSAGDGRRGAQGPAMGAGEHRETAPEYRFSQCRCGWACAILTAARIEEEKGL